MYQEDEETSSNPMDTHAHDYNAQRPAFHAEFTRTTSQPELFPTLEPSIIPPLTMTKASILAAMA
jgi:hypothetical protein